MEYGGRPLYKRGLLENKVCPIGTFIGTSFEKFILLCVNRKRWGNLYAVERFMDACKLRLSEGGTLMKRKIISILLCMAMAVHVLSGCGDDNSIGEGGTMADNAKTSGFYAFK